jgi:hypothetical protein
VNNSYRIFSSKCRKTRMDEALTMEGNLFECNALYQKMHAQTHVRARLRSEHTTNGKLAVALKICWSEVLTAVNTNITVLFDVMQYCLMERYQHFKGKWCLHLRERRVLSFSEPDKPEGSHWHNDTYWYHSTNCTYNNDECTTPFLRANTAVATRTKTEFKTTQKS